MENYEKYIIFVERIVFSKEQIPFLIEKMKEIEKGLEVQEVDYSKDIKIRLQGVEAKINNIINSIANGISQDFFSDKLKELNEEKQILTEQLTVQSNKPKVIRQDIINEENIYSLFAKYREFIKTRNLPECKKFLATYVQKVILTPDDIDVVITVPSLFEKQYNMLMHTSIECKPLKSLQKLNVGGKLIPVEPLFNREGFSGVVKMAGAN